MRLYINIMDTTLNIVELIENNPIARLSDTYQNNLLAKSRQILQIMNNNYLLQVFTVI